MIDSYECQSDVAFLMPWNGQNEDLCGDDGYDSVDARGCEPLWQALVDKKEACLELAQTESPTTTEETQETEENVSPAAICRSTRFLVVFAAVYVVCAIANV